MQEIGLTNIMENKERAMTYQPEHRLTKEVKFRVEYYSENIGAFKVSKFDDEQAAREYYNEKWEDGKRPKLFKEVSTIELEELV